MLSQPSYLMMLISLATGTLMCFLTFKLVFALHKTNLQQYNSVLTAYASLVGLGLVVLHYMNVNSFNHLVFSQFSSVNFLISSGFAFLIAFSILDASNKRNLPIKLLVLGGLQAGISSFGISYFFAKAFLGNHFEISIIPALLAVMLSMGIGMLSIITLYWLRNYEGAHPNKIRLFFSSLISIGFFASHMAFDAAIYTDLEPAINGVFNSSFITLLGAIVLILMFLTTFIVVIFYDKLNHNTIKSFNFKNTKSDNRVREAFDPLTKLPNRDSLNQHLLLAAKRCDRMGDSMAVAYIDLDHFKPVNDNFGHHVGDMLLIEVAKRFNSAMRNCDYIARTGGDEFVAILGEIEANENIVAVVQRMIDAIKEPFYIDNHLIEISCSIGIAIYPRDGNLEKLKVSADAAMYKAKESGRNQFRFYDAEIEQASDEMQKIRHELMQAIENNEFSLHFQPKVVSKTQAPAGAEVLLRWQHPTRGLLTPMYFIEAAERFGLIDRINNWVLTNACLTIFNARKRGIDLNLSVNLSRQQFRNPQLVDYIKTVMSQYNIQPYSLIFEISETHAIHNQSQFKKLLSKFKFARLRVSIDDFGLHPFSLTYLQNLEVSEVKLDRSFTAGVAKYGASLAIVDAVVKLAHALNLSVVAEGVETEEQREALLTTGCDQMQGFYFSKPIPENELFQLYKRLHDGFNQTGQFSISDYLNTEQTPEQA